MSMLVSEMHAERVNGDELTELRLHPRDVALLRTIIRVNAIYLGFGTKYTNRNRGDWPYRLRRLDALIRNVGRD